MDIKDALEVRHGDVISLVGAGGKTSVMFALARELAAAGERVITTTTTKILEPTASETELLILQNDEELLLEALRRSIGTNHHITIASEKLPSGKLRGISPKMAVTLAAMNIASYIIIEADGAAHRSLKAPSTTEPVIPVNTSLVIPVVGVDAMDCRLTEKDVFRPEIASMLLGIPMGGVITADAIALLLTHHQGIIKGSPPRARIVPFINKVDLAGGLVKGRELARKILALGHPQIEWVVLGQARFAEPAVEVILKEP